MRARLTALLEGPIAFVRAAFERVVEIEFVDRAVALAALTFTALIPLGVVVGTLSPATEGHSLANTLARRFKLDAQTRDLLQNLFSPSENVRSTLNVLGIVLLIISALSFTRGLQRVYERSWRLPTLGVRGTPAGLKWIACVALFFGFLSQVRLALIDSVGPVLGVLVSLIFSTAIWWVTPHVLMSHRIAWRPLLPTALISAVATTVVGVGSTIYMPHAIASSAASYGEIGVAISLVSWLVAVGFALVICAATGAVIAERMELTPTAAPRFPSRSAQR